MSIIRITHHGLRTQPAHLRSFRVPVASTCDNPASATVPMVGSSARGTVPCRLGGTGAASGGTLIIGHRGCAGLAPENTLAAIALAREYAPDFVELDVQLSIDGVPVIMHDATVARTTNVAKVLPDRADALVTSLTYAELRQLDAGAWYGDAYAGERIPTLREALDHAYPALGMVIELKHPALSPGLARAVADEFASDPRWDALAARGRLLVISFDAAAVHQVHALRPDIPVMVLGAVPASDAELAAVAGWAVAWGADHRTLDAADVARVHDAGMRLNAYTVNAPDAMGDVIALGADLVTSDFPDVLADVLGAARGVGSGRLLTGDEADGC